MPDRLGRLVNRGNRRRFEWLLTGPVKDEPSALPAEEGHDERYSRTDVLLINRQRIVVNVEHRVVQLIHRREGQLLLGWWRRRVENDLLEEVGNCLIRHTGRVLLGSGRFIFGTQRMNAG